MGHLQFLAMVFLLGEMCFFVTGQDDFTVQFKSQKTCFEENTAIEFEVEYTGTGTPDTLQWKFSKMTNPTNALNIVTAICKSAGGADPAFPESRMSYTCDNTLNKYTTTITGFSEATDAGTWEAALSVSSVFTNFKSVTVEKCSAPTEEVYVCFWRESLDSCLECWIYFFLLNVPLLVVAAVLIGIFVEACFEIWESMSWEWRFVSFCVFLFGLGLYLCDYFKKWLEGKPAPPVITSQSNSPNPTSILVEWEKPSDRGYAILFYKITYQKVEFCCICYRIKIDEMVEIKDIKETSFTIDNLSPGTYYEVKVYAINEKGSSSPGLKDFLTHSGKPDPPDITSQSNSPNPTSILVKWEKPSDRGFAILFYKITYQKVEFCCRIKIDVMVEIKDIKETSFTIDNLSPGTYYEVKVYAINEKGSSSPGLKDFLTHSEDDGKSWAFCCCCLAGGCCLAGQCCVARAKRNANQLEEIALRDNA